MIEVVPAVVPSQLEDAARLAAFEVLGVDADALTADELWAAGEVISCGELAVALQGVAVKGMVAFRIDDLARAAEIEALATNQAIRHQGLGRALLGYAEDVAVARGAQRMTLEALPTAAAFYARLGYRLAQNVRPNTYEKDLA